MIGLGSCCPRGMIAVKSCPRGTLAPTIGAMKTLLLLRHAKSSWDDEDLDDHDRPLNKRGKKAAPRMGELLRDERIVPDLIVTSTAKRASKTAELAAKAAGYGGTILRDHALYLAPPDRYVRVASRVQSNPERLMLVGHNPGIEMCMNMLTGDDRDMPTAALAVIMVPIETWDEMSPGLRCELASFWSPKELP